MSKKLLKFQGLVGIWNRVKKILKINCSLFVVKGSFLKIWDLEIKIWMHRFKNVINNKKQPEVLKMVWDFVN